MTITPTPADEKVPGLLKAHCPDCFRLKAKSADDCLHGLCPKWYAIRDCDSAQDCREIADRIAAAKSAPQEAQVAVGDGSEPWIPAPADWARIETIGWYNGDGEPSPTISANLHHALDALQSGKYRIVAATPLREVAAVGPVDMLLFCPACGFQHVDAAEPGTDWTNPPHRTHKCKQCKHLWRPADVQTNGVAFIKTALTTISDPILCSDCAQCRKLMQTRKEEGKTLRQLAAQVGPEAHEFKRQLSELADGLECGNPLGDCGCEGACFTSGDDDTVAESPARQGGAVEPAGYIYEWDGPFGQHQKLNDSPYNGSRPHRSYPYYIHAESPSLPVNVVREALNSTWSLGSCTPMEMKRHITEALAAHLPPDQRHLLIGGKS